MLSIVLRRKVRLQTVTQRMKTFSCLIPRRLFSSDRSVTGEEKWVLKTDLEIETTGVPSHNNWVAKPLNQDEIFEINGQSSRRKDHSDKQKKETKKIKYKDDYLNENLRTRSNKIKGFLEWNPAVCSGCGTPFQSKTPDSPGYISKERFTEHKNRAVLIKQQQEAVRLLDVAGIAVNSPLAVDILTEAGTSQEVIDGVIKVGDAAENSPEDESTDFVAEEDCVSTRGSSEILAAEDSNKSVVYGYDPVTAEPIYDLMEFRRSFEKEPKKEYANTAKTKTGDDAKSMSICRRCYRLQTYGDVEEHLRPGWSDHELLTPERFADLLSQIRKSKAVVLCLVDMFDVEGSLLDNLSEIAGRNPVIIAANKVDLLPSDCVLRRVHEWIYSATKSHCGFLSPKEADEKDKATYLEKGWFRSREIGSGSNKQAAVGILRQSDIHLISCETGKGIGGVLEKVTALAASHGERIYVMGTANVGKSSFINRLLEYSESRPKKGKKHKKSSTNPQATVSNLPGTTLDFLKIRLPDGIMVYDTPGLINKGQLTSRLTPSELRSVIPKKRVKHITLRVEQGRVVMMGGLARIEHMEGRPFLCTFFLSNKVSIHPTRAERVEDLLQSHSGSILFPPHDYNRIQELGPMEDVILEIPGNSWAKSSKDIVIAGLGWLSVTGPSEEGYKIKVTVPQGTTVRVRDPIMPFEARETTVSHTGARFIKKSAKQLNIKTKKKRKKIKQEGK